MRCLIFTVVVLSSAVAATSRIAADPNAAAEPVKKLILPGEAFFVAERPAFILLPPEGKHPR